jgi:hypothetical protein
MFYHHHHHHHHHLQFVLLLYLFLRAINSEADNATEPVETKVPLIRVPVQSVIKSEESMMYFDLFEGDAVPESVEKFCDDNYIAPTYCEKLINDVFDNMSNVKLVGLNIGNKFQRNIHAFVNENRELPREIPYYIAPPMENAKRVCIIHSCTLQGQQFDVLGDMLDIMKDSGALIVLDYVLILNYGVQRNLPKDFQENFPSISLVQVSDSCRNFENPSILTLQGLVRQMRSDAHILYMHTKGISYSPIPSSVHDWRRYMMYFLVEKHQACYHLLESGEIDVIGTNIWKFLRDGSNIIVGNFWWASVAYLQKLPDFAPADKYSPETFVLSTGKARFYSMHTVLKDSIVLGETDFPRESYINDSPACILGNGCMAWMG